MSDFPTTPVTPLHVSSFSRYCGAGGALHGLAAPASATWSSSNVAYFYPMFLPWPYLVQRFFWGNGANAGTMDAGIYTRGGKLLASTGAVAQTPASDLQYAAPSGGAILLTPGEYLLAISNNGTTGRGWGSTQVSAIEARLCGYYSMAAAHALPATATLAIAQANQMLVGITRTASGF